VAVVSSLPQEWIAALQQMSGELAAIREQLAAQAAQLQRLEDRNTILHSKLEHSEQARVDLLAQTERILELLAEARQELRERAAGR